MTAQLPLLGRTKGDRRGTNTRDRLWEMNGEEVEGLIPRSSPIV